MVGPAGLLVYDGDCGFCTSAARAIERRWRGTPRPSTIAFQRLGADDAAAAGLTAQDLASAAWWLDDVRRDSGARAIARALIAAGGVLGVLGRLLLVPPVSLVAALCYDVVARNRHRLPGTAPACRR